MDNKEEIKNGEETSVVETSTNAINEQQVEPQPISQEPVEEPKTLTSEPIIEPKMNNIFPTLESSHQPESPIKSNTETQQDSLREQNISNEIKHEEEIPQISLNGTEKVVYEYKAKKTIGPIPILLFFLAIGAMIIFLPNIQEAFTNFKNGRLPVNGNNTNTNKPVEKPISEEKKEPEEKEYYDLSKDTIISIDKLTLSNFSKTKDKNLYYLTFNIENKDNSPYFYQDNIYIRMYSNNELLGSALLEENTILQKTEKKELKLVIPETVYTRDFQIAVKKLTTNDYPDIELRTNLKEQQELTCSLEGRTLTYTFLNNELLGIDDQITESTVLYSTPEEYNNVLTSYQDKSNRYNMITGITSNLTNNVNGFSFYVKIDPITVTNADFNTINDRAYYLGKTNAKTISFEMKARGYTCK
ncbi:MAG: hypothetical protein ACI31M_02095 [Bacilli bacterium]